MITIEFDFTNLSSNSRLLQLLEGVKILTFPFAKTLLIQDIMSNKPAADFGWFPTTPTVLPFILANPTTILLAQSGIIWKNSLSSTVYNQISILNVNWFVYKIVVCMLILVINWPTPLHLLKTEIKGNGLYTILQAASYQNIVLVIIEYVLNVCFLSMIPCLSIHGEQFDDNGNTTSSTWYKIIKQNQSYPLPDMKRVAPNYIAQVQ